MMPVIPLPEVPGYAVHLMEKQRMLEQKIYELQCENAELRALLLKEQRTWLTPNEAATLCGRTSQTIRLWCKGSHIGIFDGVRWRVSRDQLKSYLIDRFGKDLLPIGLRD
jgi:hypothetical protein